MQALPPMQAYPGHGFRDRPASWHELVTIRRICLGFGVDDANPGHLAEAGDVRICLCASVGNSYIYPLACMPPKVGAIFDSAIAAHITRAERRLGATFQSCRQRGGGAQIIRFCYHTRAACLDRHLVVVACGRCVPLPMPHVDGAGLAFLVLQLRPGRPRVAQGIAPGHPTSGPVI